jgi:YegS/Rv2252/BmrU family lipid kinase
VNSKIKILFIINPISGVGKKKIIPKCIDKYLDKTKFTYLLEYTQYRRHAHKITQQNKEKFNVIVAIGGDGTVNEVGSALIHSNCAMAIIPTGSGNGLAHHLNIPSKIKDALLKINQYQVKKIDTGLVNNLPFIGTCGFGFDAHIAKKFDEYHKRGLISYTKLVRKEFKNYQPLSYKVNINDEVKHFETFMFSVANSSEFGNGFVISPDSDSSDGIFENVCLAKFKFKDVFKLGKQIFSRQINQSKHFSSFTANCNYKIEVLNQQQTLFHIDGESLEGKSEFEIKIVPNSLKIIC